MLCHEAREPSTEQWSLRSFTGFLPFEIHDTVHEDLDLLTGYEKADMNTFVFILNTYVSPNSLFIFNIPKKIVASTEVVRIEQEAIRSECAFGNRRSYLLAAQEIVSLVGFGGLLF